MPERRRRPARRTGIGGSVLALSTLLGAYATPVTAQATVPPDSSRSSPPRADGAGESGVLARGALATLIAAGTWVIFVKPAADYTHRSLELRSDDWGNLNGAIASAPLMATPGAALGAWLLTRQPQSFGYHWAAAVAGAYLPAVALTHLERSTGTGIGYPSFVVWLGAPLSAVATSMGAAGLGWEVAVAGSLLDAPESRGVCRRRGSCLGDFTDPNRVEVTRPARNRTASVSVRRPAGERWHLGVDLTGLVIDDRVEDLRRGSARSRGNRVASTLLFTAAPTLVAEEGWSFEVMAGLGSTTYHQRLGLATAVGLSVARAVGAGAELVVRGRGYWLPEVQAFEVGMALRFSPVEG